MGTSADIGRLNEDGTYDFFHISYDGYLSGAGAKLFKHYQSPDKIDALFAMKGSPSLESSPSQMTDNGWDDNYSPDDLLYLYRDGAWWYQDYEIRPCSAIPTGKTAWREITREMLIADDPDTEVYLDGTAHEPSVEERFSDFNIRQVSVPKPEPIEDRRITFEIQNDVLADHLMDNPDDLQKLGELLVSALTRTINYPAAIGLARFGISIVGDDE